MRSWRLLPMLLLTLSLLVRGHLRCCWYLFLDLDWDSKTFQILDLQAKTSMRVIEEVSSLRFVEESWKKWEKP